MPGGSPVPEPASVPVVILAGGLGTRLREETEFRPKPMVEVGGKPVLWHIMRGCAHFGTTEFVVAVGYRGDVIKDYFLNYQTRANDFTVRLGARGDVTIHQTPEARGAENWRVTVVDTGPDTQTGGRVWRARQHLPDTGPFIVTYGDGLADVDLRDLLEFHASHGRLATVTTVQPLSRFGMLALSEDGVVMNFREKPQIEDWVNAGYFVFEPEVLGYLDADCTLEQEPLARLAADSQLVAYRHVGFWQPMDTYREATLLNGLWQSGEAPWKVWT